MDMCFIGNSFMKNPLSEYKVDFKRAQSWKWLVVWRLIFHQLHRILW